jgi:hypothetical protein
MNRSSEDARPRRLTLADSIVLIAALGIGLWVSRYGLILWLSVLFGGFDRQVWTSRPIALSWHWGTLILRHTQPSVGILTLTVFGLSFVHPRPTLRQMAQQPGFVSCLAASLAIVVGGSLNFATCTTRPNPGYELQNYTSLSLTRLCSEPGLAIGACWMTLALSHAWRSDRTWTERAGTMLGAYWLAMSIIAKFAPGVFP